MSPASCLANGVLAPNRSAASSAAVIDGVESMRSDYVPYPAVVCVTAPSAISAVARFGISRAECEIHEIPGQAISEPLYWGPRLLGALDRFDKDRKRTRLNSSHY